MRRLPRQLAPAWLAILVACLPAGCIIVPYRPAATTVHDRVEIANPDRLRLSVGPRTLLEQVAKAIRAADRRVEFVDGQQFIDTASPTRGLTLAAIREPATEAPIQPLLLDFIILVARPVTRTINEQGALVFYSGVFGAATTEGSTMYWTAVLDARTLTMVEQLRSESVGTDAAMGFFYGLFVVSDTSGSARKDLVRNIVDVMAVTRPTGRVRVALLAVEPMGPTPVQPPPAPPAPGKQ